MAVDRDIQFGSSLMEFLAPFFAMAGALAAGVPLVLHMLRRAPTQRLPFSLVRFLDSSQPKLTRRSTVEHWPLLLLRILALVLLGLAFARPFQRTADTADSPDNPGRSVTLLIDRSASMSRIGIRDAVVQEVRSTVEGLTAADRLHVAFFSNIVETIVQPESWTAFSSGERSAAIERLCREYKSDWHATHTGSALQQTAEDLVQHSDLDTEHQIILVTDFQEGSDFGPLSPGGWPTSVRVSLRIVKPQEPGNASLHTMIDRRTGKSLVRISNDADATTTRFAVRPLNSAGLLAGTEIKVNTVPGRQVTLPLSSLTLSEDAVSLSLVGDSHEFDNRVPLPVTSTRISKIAHTGPTDVNDADNMRYYLQRALDGMTTDADTQTVAEAQLKIFDTVTSEGLVLPVPDDVGLAILTDTVPLELLPSLTAMLDRGGVLVASLKSESMSQSIHDLLPEGVVISEAPVSDYAMLGRIDFEHPLFAEFSASRFADFSSIRFWKHRAIDLPSPDGSDAEQPLPWKVIARFDSGMPAIVRIRRESGGEIYLLASGWHPDDSQWALSSRFAPMLAGFLRLAQPDPSEYQHLIVGDVFNPTKLVGSSRWTIERPDGTLDSFEDNKTVDKEQITVDQPGRFTVHSSADHKDTTVTLLTEISADESRTTTLPAGQLYGLGLAADETPTEIGEVNINSRQSLQASAAELEDQQKYWRWFLVAGLSCLVVEALLAAVIHRRQLEAA